MLWKFHWSRELKRDFTATETWQTPKGEGGFDAHLSSSDTAFLPRFPVFTSLSLLLEDNKQACPWGSIPLLSPARRDACKSRGLSESVANPGQGFPCSLDTCILQFFSQSCSPFLSPVPWPRGGFDEVHVLHRCKSMQLQQLQIPSNTAQGVRINCLVWSVLRAVTTMTSLGRWTHAHTFQPLL